MRFSNCSISAGVRRIEAITGYAAEQYFKANLDLIKELQELLKNPKDLKKSVESLLQERNELKKEIEALHAAQAGQLKQDLLQQVKKGAVNKLMVSVKLPSADALKKIAFELKNEVGNLVAVLAAEIDGKPQVAVIISEELVQSKGLNAGNAVRDLAKEIQGGGGGQPFFATAGGKDITGLSRVVEKAEALFADL